MAIAELESQSSTSHEVFKSREAIFRGRTTFRTLLEMGNKEDGVGLADIPFDFEAFDRGGHFLFIASFPDEASLTGKSLVKVLRAAKPDNYSWLEKSLGTPASQSLTGVAADWDIIAAESRKTNPFYQALYNIHSVADQNFVEFENNHFPLFWRAINADDNHDGIVPVIAWRRDKITGEALYYCGKTDGDNHDTLLGQIVVAGYSLKVKRSLPTKLQLPITSRLLLELQNTNPTLFKVIISRYLRRKQDMGEAQMPTFVRRYTRRFLNESPVIANLEELAGVPRVRPRAFSDSFPFSNVRR